MTSFKIYGEKYPLEESSSEAPDAYGFRNKLVDDVPSGKSVGYVTMNDGSIIECYYKFNIFVVLLPIVVAVLIGVITLIYLISFQEKDVVMPGGVVIKEGKDANVVSYNGFMAIEDGEISICFQNGSEKSVIKVVGKGIKTDPVTVEPNEYVASIPATFTTDAGVVKAKIVIETPTSTVENETVVEIPTNNTADSPESGLEGYWKGEYIYGTEIDGVE